MPPAQAENADDFYKSLQVGAAHLDLIYAPYVVYGVK